MTDGQIVGLVLVLAMVALYVRLLIPAVLVKRRLDREWRRLRAQVDEARDDFTSAEDIAAWEQEMSA